MLVFVILYYFSLHYHSNKSMDDYLYKKYTSSSLSEFLVDGNEEASMDKEKEKEMFMHITEIDKIIDKLEKIVNNKALIVKI